MPTINEMLKEYVCDTCRLQASRHCKKTCARAKEFKQSLLKLVGSARPEKVESKIYPDSYHGFNLGVDKYYSNLISMINGGKE